MRKMIEFMFGYLIFVLVSCSTTDTEIVTPEVFSQNAVLDVQEQQVETLAPGDRIEFSVEVDGLEEIPLHSASVNSGGMVTIPLVGDIGIGGQTIAEARAVITQAYSKFFVTEPVVMIAFSNEEEGGEWGFVTVTGMVAQPGRVPLRSSNGMKLTELIQAAGGFGLSARQTAVQVTRQGDGGKKIQVSVNYKDIGQDGDAGKDITLVSGDIVYVPHRIF